jgi:hypothetical protein
VSYSKENALRAFVIGSGGSKLLQREISLANWRCARSDPKTNTG